VTCWVVIPIKAPGACKTRLAGVLDDAARRDLVARMLDHVVATARAASGIDDVMLLGPARHGMPESMRRLDDPGQGLNAALTSATRVAAGAGVERLLFVSADLPWLVPGDLTALVALPAGVAGIAPDRAGTGTNALSLPGRDATRFAPHFGIGSFAAHRREARRLGIGLEIIATPTLAFDVDLPADLDTLDAAANRAVVRIA
jgi:2-phospho-L-lactate guanylyltransferase